MILYLHRHITVKGMFMLVQADKTQTANKVLAYVQ